MCLIFSIIDLKALFMILKIIDFLLIYPFSICCDFLANSFCISSSKLLFSDKILKFLNSTFISFGKAF